MTVVLACDLGSTSLRVALVDENGRVLHAVSLASASASVGESDEIDPRLWRDVFASAVGRLAEAAGVAFDAVEAIAISSLTRTQVFLGPDHEPLRPAITWRDTRAQAVIEHVRGLFAAAHPEAAQLTTFHPLARLAWLAQEEPQTARRLRAVVEPKDYLNLWLTGECTIDPVGSARLLAARDGLKGLGYDESVVSHVVEPGVAVGHVRRGLPGALGRLAGRPVIAMGSDTWASVIGLGALRDGYAYNLSGTTEVLGVLSRKQAAADGLLTVDWRNGLSQLGGPSQNGADTLVWLMSLLGQGGKEPGTALEALLAGPRDAQPLLFLPYLRGERTPHWDPALRGAFVGLNRRHGPADCARAALEGIAFLNRLVLERAEAATGRKVGEIRFGGGGAANAAWCQIKADICGRTVAVADSAEPGLLGAAIVALTALDRFKDLVEGQAALVRVRQRHEPRAETTEFYDRLYGLYREAESALAPISRKLVSLQHDMTATPRLPA
jgi:xylulokinase